MNRWTSASVSASESDWTNEWTMELKRVSNAAASQEKQGVGGGVVWVRAGSKERRRHWRICHLQQTKLKASFGLWQQQAQGRRDSEGKRRTHTHTHSASGTAAGSSCTIPDSESGRARELTERRVGGRGGNFQHSHGVGGEKLLLRLHRMHSNVLSGQLSLLLQQQQQQFVDNVHPKGSIGVQHASSDRGTEMKREGVSVVTLLGTLHCRLTWEKNLWGA